MQKDVRQKFKLNNRLLQKENLPIGEFSCRKPEERVNERKGCSLKGQLKVYMYWPVIMTVLLIAMNFWMYHVNRKAGIVMTVFTIIYAVIVGGLYFYNRSLILADMIRFVFHAIQGDTEYAPAGIISPVCDFNGRTEKSSGKIKYLKRFLRNTAGNERIIS